MVERVSERGWRTHGHNQFRRSIFRFAKTGSHSVSQSFLLASFCEDGAEQNIEGNSDRANDESGKKESGGRRWKQIGKQTTGTNKLEKAGLGQRC